VKFILFNIGGERFGTSILNIQGVERLKEIIRVRNEKNNWVLGNIFWFHSLLPVVDLLGYLRGRELKTDITRQNEQLLVVGDEQKRKIGIAVEKIDRMVNIDEKEICELPETVLSSRNKRFLSGVWKEEMVLLLNLERLLSEEEWKILERVGRE